MTSASRAAALSDLPLLPRDEDGPVFEEPWQAQAFAVVVELIESGDLSREEWANALGAALKARGVKALYGDLGFSDSHTLLIEYPHANSAVALLDEAGISANTCPLPWDTAESVTGLRIGTQVVTRRGMKQEQMELIADAIARVLLEADNPRQVQRDIIQPLASSFNGVAYSFDDHFALGGDWQHRGYSPSATASTGTSHAPMSVLH